MFARQQLPQSRLTRICILSRAETVKFMSNWTICL